MEKNDKKIGAELEKMRRERAVKEVFNTMGVMKQYLHDLSDIFTYNTNNWLIKEINWTELYDYFEDMEKSLESIEKYISEAKRIIEKQKLAENLDEPRK